MVEQHDFQTLQRKFCAHIRRPDAVPLPDGIEDRRMAVYRDLFFNNVAGFIEAGFPVLRSLYDDDQWQRLTRAFFANHRCKTPYFAQIAEEFLDFLQHEYQPEDDDPPFLLELAHYEWAELALSVLDTTADFSRIDRHGDLLSETPVLSPTAWLLSYQWPVQHISVEFQPEQPLEQPVHIIVYRNGDDEVGFIEANPVTARLFQLLDENDSACGRALLEAIAEELHHPDPAVVIDGGHQILTRLHRLDIILGTRPAGNA